MSGQRSPMHRQRTFLSIVLVLILGTIGLGCQSTGSGASEGTGPSGSVYYTRFAIQVNRGTCRSTNYRASGGGVTIPINTEVEFDSRRRHRFNMHLVGGRDFIFEHVPKHTMDTAAKAFDSFFSVQPTDLSSFSAKERNAIEAGEIEVGMRRKAVLASAGPPPAVGTLNLDAPIWKYWTNRFITFTVHFDSNGKVSSKSR
jgi:hypothetical protein